MVNPSAQGESKPLVMGIDVGGTNVRLAVFDGVDCVKLIRVEANFSSICANHPPAIAWQKILDLLSDGIADLYAEYPAVENVGVGFPGFIDPKTNLIESSPNLPGLNNVNLTADLTVALQRRHIPLLVKVANDANVAALGEYYLADEPVGGFIFCGLGTGVGGGLVLNGQLYAGNHGCAMEVGHIIVEPNGRQCGCGNLGCLETYASATGVSKGYALLTDEHKSAAEIATLAESGNAAALQVYDDAANRLAQALATVVKVVDIKTIVIGGGVAAAWHLMQAPFHTRFTEDLMPVLRDKVTVKLASTNDLAGMVGAAKL